MKDSSVPSYKIIQGYYLLGGGQETIKYDFKIYRGHPDFNKIEKDNVCWTFYQSKDILTPIPAIIRVDKVFSGVDIVRAKLNMEKQQRYPIMPIVKVIEDFDFELLGYMFAVHNRFQSDLGKLKGDDKKLEITTIPPKGRIKLRHDIYILKNEGKSISSIAKAKGISRNTVKRYLQLNTHEFLSVVSNGNSLEEYRNEILDYLYNDHKISSQNIYDKLQTKYGDIGVGFRQVARYVKELREKHKIRKEDH